MTQCGQADDCTVSGDLLLTNISEAEGSQNWPLERWDYEGETENTAWKAAPKAENLGRNGDSPN